MQFFPILANFRLQDLLDILLITVLVYHLYLWFWGTKAFKALVGLVALGGVFTIAKSWGLFLTTWVFQILWQVLVILLIILFQSEIRQALERVNPLRMVKARNFLGRGEWMARLAKGVMALGKGKIGALVVVERVDLVDEWMTGGISLEADLTPEMLMTIFQRTSPLHDGAMVIKKGRIWKVACYLPLSSREDLPDEWGTRHRAALGLSERCDALVLIVSEESGRIGIVKDGKFNKVSTLEELKTGIGEAINANISRPGINWSSKLTAFLKRRIHIKLGVLAIVSIFWFLLAGQQNFEVTLNLPIEVKNKPVNLKIIDPINPVVKVICRGMRKDAGILNEENVRVELDLSLARWGRRTFRITRDQVILPNENVSIVKIEPPIIKFRFKEIAHAK